MTTPAINVTSGRDILLHSVNLAANTTGGVKLAAANSVNINNFDVCGGACGGFRSITAAGNIGITATAGAITRTVDDGVKPERGFNVTLAAGANVANNFGSLTARLIP